MHEDLKHAIIDLISQAQDAAEQLDSDGYEAPASRLMARINVVELLLKEDREYS